MRCIALSCVSCSVLLCVAMCCLCVVGVVSVVVCVAGLVCRCMLLLLLDDVLFGG